ncbi:MAG: hypothetical protein AAGF20_05295 [Pseudomonadota bacterium]
MRYHQTSNDTFQDFFRGDGVSIASHEALAPDQAHASEQAYSEEQAFESAEVAFQESLSQSGLPFPEGMDSDMEWVELYSEGVTYHDGAVAVFPDLEGYSAEEIDDALFEMIEGMTDAEFRRFWSRIKRGARKVAGKVARFAAPVVSKAGGALGAVIGGPAGAVIGRRLGQGAGRALGRGLTRFSQTGRVPRVRWRRPTRANPLFNRQQVAQGVNRLTGILTSPQVQQAIAMEAYNGEAEGGYSLMDGTLDEVAETILDLADQIEAVMMADGDWG